jgi:hypothetical protein
MTLAIANIYRHPVKGLTPERLARVELTPGEGLPYDRRFAIAHGATRFDPGAPEWMPKTNFLMLMKDERLAKLRTSFDDATGLLTIERDGKTVGARQPRGADRPHRARAVLRRLSQGRVARRAEDRVGARPHVLRRRRQGGVDHRPRLDRRPRARRARTGRSAPLPRQRLFLGRAAVGRDAVGRPRDRDRSPPGIKCSSR